MHNCSELLAAPRRKAVIVYSLFYGVVISSDRPESNSMINSELICGRKKLCPNLRYDPDIFQRN